MGRAISRVTFSGILFLCLIPWLAAASSVTYQYDANGDLVSDGGKYYTYNDANQLTTVRHGSPTGPVIAEYFYDHQGQRVKKVENGITTYYIGKHTEMRVGDGPTASTNYYFANGERVAKKDPAGNLYYYHADHLGSTNVMTNAAGNLVERVGYYPFGQIREGGNERYAYTGKEKDNLTDWYYYEARYYNPGYFQFTQADTVMPNLYDPQDLNRYAYARNNPLKFVDPDGRSFLDTMVNYASHTGAGRWLGDKLFNYMVDPQISQAPPETQAQYYGALAEGLDHTYAVTKEASSSAVGGILSLAAGDVKGALGDVYTLSVILGQETGYMSQAEIDLLYTVGDLYGLSSVPSDVGKLGKHFKFDQVFGAGADKKLRHLFKNQRYYAMIRYINKNKLFDAHRIGKTVYKMGDIVNKNVDRYHD